MLNKLAIAKKNVYNHRLNEDYSDLLNRKEINGIFTTIKGIEIHACIFSINIIA
jgi:hypothetical protein